MDRRPIDRTDRLRRSVDPSGRVRGPDALRGYVPEPAAEEPSQRHRSAGSKVRVLDRIVLGAAYAVQWLRSKWSSRHEGRS
jgi:hypothetical protein